MLKQRLLTAAVLIPAVVLIIGYAPPDIFALAAALVMLPALWEWGGLAGLGGGYARHAYLLCLPMLILASLLFVSIQKPIVLAALIFWLCAAPGLLWHERWRRLLRRDAVRLSVGLLVMLAAWLSLLVMYLFGPLLYLLVLIWTADIGAYCCGRLWGRKKLAPLISPGKTWEGAYGALCLTAILALAYGWRLPFDMAQLLLLLVVSICTVVMSIIGDLTVSILKREAGVKQSGRLLPGHGGMLDRLDSLLAAAPVFLCGCWLMGWPIQWPVEL